MRPLLPLALAAAVSSGVALAPVPASAQGLVDPAPNVYDAGGVGLGEFTALCDYTGIRANMDPIVAPGSSSFMHSHDFFGNSSVNPESTPNSLRAQPDTTCTPTADGSSYWIPTLLENGQPIDADSLTAYYTVKQPMDPNVVVDMPADMRMIAGGAKASTPQGLDRIAWTCIGSSQMSPTIQDCGGGTLQLAVFFPQCWDGVRTDSPDHVSHVVYADFATGCPDSHPVLIPQLELQFRWQTTAGAQWSVSSDPMVGATGGQTAHADFLNGWTLDEQHQRTEDCLRWPVVCLTDGQDRRLSQGLPVPSRPTTTNPDSPSEGDSTSIPPSHNNGTPAAPENPPVADTGAPVPVEQRIPATTFTAQNGVRTEATSDIGGGQNIGWLSSGDWAAYDRVDFREGVQSVSVRWASAVNRPARLEFRIGSPTGELLASVSTQETGGWQQWITLQVPTQAVVQGVQDVYLVVQRDTDQLDVGNVNWWGFTAVGDESSPLNQAQNDQPVVGETPTINPTLQATSRIEAESFDSQVGLGVEASTDIDGGQNIGWMADGDWARWDAVEFTGQDRFTVRAASAVAVGGRVELRLGALDGEVIGSIPVPQTGGWQTWDSISFPLSKTITGTHTLYLVATAPQSGVDIGNINWLRFDSANTSAVSRREFWSDQRGIGFSVSSLGRYPSPQRLNDALDRVIDLNYTMVRTWGADDYTRMLLSAIDERGLDLKVQIGVWITDDANAQAALDRALATIAGYEDHVLALSLGNEQLADWNTSTLTAADVLTHVDYIRARSDVGVTYNFSDSTLRAYSSFWSTGGVNLLRALDYINVHNYGATFAGSTRTDLTYSPDQQLSLLRDDARWLTDLLTDLDLGDIPLVLGETGWQSSGYAPEVTNAAQAQAYSEGAAQLIYLEDSRYDSMFYFNLSDEEWKNGDDHWGLFFEGDDSTLGDAKFDLSRLRVLNER